MLAMSEGGSSSGLDSTLYGLGETWTENWTTGHSIPYNVPRLRDQAHRAPTYVILCVMRA